MKEEIVIQCGPLTRIAAEMHLGKGMPSECVEDWDFPKSMSKKQKEIIIASAVQARDQCRAWALEIKKACAPIGKSA